MEPEIAAQVKEVFEDLGRPSADVLIKELARRKLRVPQKLVRAFVNARESAQVFHPAPASDGHIIAFHPRERFQADILDQSTKDPKKNDGYRFGLLVQDVYTRKLAGVPLRGKVPAETKQAFREACDQLGGFPKQLQTDQGGEFAGPFEAFLRERRVEHVVKDVRHTNALAVVDSSIARVRRAMAREMVESGGGDWVGPFRKAIAAINKRPLDHLLGARPLDVDANSELKYALNAKAGEAQLEQTSQIETKERALETAGAFRTLLPRQKNDKTDKPRWSGEVHKIASIRDGFVVGQDGVKERVRFALPVGAASKEVKFASALVGGESAQDKLINERLRPFVEGLAAHIGGGSLSLTDAGTFLSELPGWREVLAELKIKGRGLKALLGRSPELKIEGQAVSRA